MRRVVAGMGEASVLPGRPPLVFPLGLRGNFLGLSGPSLDTFLLLCVPGTLRCCLSSSERKVGEAFLEERLHIQYSRARVCV